MEQKIFILFLLAIQCLATAEECAPGQLDFSGQCVGVNYIQGCARYDKSGICLDCDFGYVNKATYCTKSIGKPTNCCKTFKTDGSCDECADGLLKIGRSCVRDIQLGCLQRQNGQCSNCAVGYLLESGSCLKTIQGCLDYQISGLCSKCQNGYQYSNGLCYTQKASPQISNVQNCEISNQYGCVQCAVGYHLNKEAQCPQNHLGCLQYYREKCLFCRKGYQLSDKGQCQMDGCQSYSGVGCSRCAQAYQIKQGKCLLQNCFYARNGKCLICGYGQRIRNGECIPQSQILNEKICQQSNPLIQKLNQIRRQ